VSAKETVRENSMKYKLKDGVLFHMVNKKSKMSFDFNLSDYYDKETRTFIFPQGYVAWHLMAEVFREFLIPLDLVEKIEDSENKGGNNEK